MQQDIDLPWQLTDSIRYAGHDVLQILSSSKLIGELDREFQVDTTKNSRGQQRQRMGVLKLAMRNESKVRELKTGFVSDKFEQEGKNTLNFFEGLFEYTRQLILSYQNLLSEYQNESLSVGVVLLGNGWRLGGLVYESTDQEPIKGLIKTMVNYLNKNLSNINDINIVFPVSGEVSVKESIAYGSLLYNPIENEKLGNKNNEKFSFIGTTQLSANNKQLPYFLTRVPDKYRRDNQQSIQIEKLPDFPRNSNFEEQLNLVKGWENKGLHFSRTELNNQLRAKWLSKEKYLLISPMRYFLENVWKEKVLFGMEE